MQLCDGHSSPQQLPHPASQLLQHCLRFAGTLLKRKSSYRLHILKYYLKLIRDPFVLFKLVPWFQAPGKGYNGRLHSVIFLLISICPLNGRFTINSLHLSLSTQSLFRGKKRGSSKAFKFSCVLERVWAGEREKLCRNTDSQTCWAEESNRVSFTSTNKLADAMEVE